MPRIISLCSANAGRLAHPLPALMVACLMRLSPLPGRARREEGLAPLRLHKETCAGMQLPPLRLLQEAATSSKIKHTEKIELSIDSAATAADFGSALPPSLFLQCVICHRSAIISGGKDGKVDETATAVPFLPPRPSFAQSKFDRRPTDDWRGDVFPSVRAFRLRSQRACRVGFARMYRRRRCWLLRSPRDGGA